MLRLMINSHPNLAVPHETGFITEYMHELDKYGDLGEKSNCRRLLDDIAQHHHVVRGGHISDSNKILAHPIKDYADLVDAILAEYAAAYGKPRWGDKTPSYTSEIDLLWKLFPGCKIIHLVRDGRDVLISQRKMEWMSNSVPRLAEGWRWTTTLCHKVGSVLGDDYYLELRYEELVCDAAGAMRRICDFLGEPFERAMLEHDKVAESMVPTESRKWHEHSVRAPDTSKLYAWKEQLSVSDRIIFEQIAGDALELFGYEIERRPSTLRSKLKKLYYAILVRW